VVADPLRAELPADLDSARLLELSGPDRLAGGEGGFDFVVCRDALRESPYPMALLAELWRLTAPGALLLLEAEIDPDPEHSAYAGFRPGGGWVPGRLALRWMVEVAGFDVERWLGDPTAPGEPPRARLRAVRAKRHPASSSPPVR
jgi:hypothetical protein